MQNQVATAPSSKNVSRYLLSRAPGILFATAALFLSFSGAAAPALDTDVAPPPLPNVAEAEPQPTPHADAPLEEAAPEPEAASPDTDDARTYTTGDRLTQEEMAAFYAHIAAMKADGKHRGAAVYTSW